MQYEIQQQRCSIFRFYNFLLMEKYPVVITLQLEEAAAAFFTEQRKAYFPAHINYLEAHLTLFHALPAEVIIKTTLQNVCTRKAFDVQVNGIKNIGRGVAYSVSSAELISLHRSLQKEWEAFLTGKDKQPLWPHITVQNKVTAFKALKLYQQLSAGFKTFSVKATGINTWYYLGGPWKQIEFFPFQQ